MLKAGGLSRYLGNEEVMMRPNFFQDFQQEMSSDRPYGNRNTSEEFQMSTKRDPAAHMSSVGDSEPTNAGDRKPE